MEGGKAVGAAATKIENFVSNLLNTSTAFIHLHFTILNFPVCCKKIFCLLTSLCKSIYMFTGCFDIETLHNLFKQKFLLHRT